MTTENITMGSQDLNDFLMNQISTGNQERDQFAEACKKNPLHAIEWDTPRLTRVITKAEKANEAHKFFFGEGEKIGKEFENALQIAEYQCRLELKNHDTRMIDALHNPHTGISQVIRAEKLIAEKEFWTEFQKLLREVMKSYEVEPWWEK